MGIRTQLRFASNVLRKAVDYVRYDVKEIVLPSSLPDPPGTVYDTKKLPVRTHLTVWLRAFRVYGRSWKVSLGFIPRSELRGPAPESAGKHREEPEEPTIAQEIAAAAKAGGEGLRPVLQKLYMSRARGYRDALQSFVGGYQEGLKEAMERAAHDDAVWKTETGGEKDGESASGAGGGEREVGVPGRKEDGRIGDRPEEAATGN